MSYLKFCFSYFAASIGSGCPTKSSVNHRLGLGFFGNRAIDLLSGACHASGSSQKSKVASMSTAGPSQDMHILASVVFEQTHRNLQLQVRLAKDMSISSGRMDLEMCGGNATDILMKQGPVCAEFWLLQPNSELLLGPTCLVTACLLSLPKPAGDKLKLVFCLTDASPYPCPPWGQIKHAFELALLSKTLAAHKLQTPTATGLQTVRGCLAARHIMMCGSCVSLLAETDH